MRPSSRCFAPSTLTFCLSRSLPRFLTSSLLSCHHLLSQTSAMIALTPCAPPTFLPSLPIGMLCRFTRDMDGWFSVTDKKLDSEIQLDLDRGSQRVSVGRQASRLPSSLFLSNTVPDSIQPPTAGEGRRDWGRELVLFGARKVPRGPAKALPWHSQVHPGIHTAGYRAARVLCADAGYAAAVLTAWLSGWVDGRSTQ
eukprot:3322425-Rhodomonas_salina.1